MFIMDEAAWREAKGEESARGGGGGREPGGADIQGQHSSE